MAAWYDQVKDTFVRNVANMYLQKVGLEAFSIFPSISVNRLTGYIAKYTKSDWLEIGTINDYKRIGAVESVGDDYAVGEQAYTVEDYAFHKDVTKNDRNDYDNPYEPVRDATEWVVNRIRRVILKNIADTCFASSYWGTDKDGSGGDFTQWDDGSETPVDDVLTWQEIVEKNTGFKPNRIIMSADVYRALKVSSDITDKMKNTSDKVVSVDLLAKLFEVDTVNVLRDVNSGGGSYMIGGKLILCYTPARPSKFTPSAGYHMLYKHGDIKDKKTVKTERIPMKHLNDALRIEASITTCFVQVASDLGLYAYNVVS